MTRKTTFRVIIALAIFINIGVWLAGVYGLELHVGSYVLGRHVGINDKETYSSILGWLITIGATVALFIVLYRNC